MTFELNTILNAGIGTLIGISIYELFILIVKIVQIRKGGE